MEAETLVTNEQGERYTEDGLRTMIHKLATELVSEKKVKPGLNIHGLRHSLGKELYDLGLEREARKAVMAHESDAASKVYERDGDSLVGRGLYIDLGGWRYNVFRLDRVDTF